MIVLVFISIIAVLFTYFEYRKNIKNGMLIGFLILSIVLGIRFEYGNDYISYAQKFSVIGTEPFEFSNLMDGSISDPLWFIINKLFYYLGFESMIMFLTVIASYAYYKLIRLLPPCLWIFGVFIYLFTYTFMPMQLSMLRQALAMSLIVIATLDILDKKKIKPALLLTAAAGIHSSAIICIPFILLLYLEFVNHKKIVLFIFVCVFLLFFISKDFLLQFLGDTISSMDSVDSLAKYDEKYFSGNKYEASSSKSLFGIILYLFPIIVNLYYIIKSKDEKMIKLSVLYIWGAFIFLLDQIIPMIGRLAWYFTIFSIVSLPLAFKNINDKILRTIFMALFIAVTLKEYNDFFHAINWRDAYISYKTIFSV